MCGAFEDRVVGGGSASRTAARDSVHGKGQQGRRQSAQNVEVSGHPHQPPRPLRHLEQAGPQVLLCLDQVPLCPARLHAFGGECVGQKAGAAPRRDGGQHGGTGHAQSGRPQGEGQQRGARAQQRVLAAPVQPPIGP